MVQVSTFRKILVVHSFPTNPFEFQLSRSQLTSFNPFSFMETPENKNLRVVLFRPRIGDKSRTLGTFYKKYESKKVGL